MDDSILLKCSISNFSLGGDLKNKKLAMSDHCLIWP